MPDLPSKRLIFASPWIFIAAVGILLGIILVFAVDNLRREQRLLSENLFNRGQGVIRLMEAGARSSMMRMARPDALQMQDLIEQTAEEESILYIAVVDSNGLILAHNQPELIGTTLSFALPPAPGPEAAADGPPPSAAAAFRLLTETGFAPRVFEVHAPFNPLAGRGHHWRERGEQNQLQRPRMGHMWFRNEMAAADGTAPFFAGPGQRLILVGLDMRAEEAVISRNRRHIFFISLALLLAGLGGWLALLTAQGHRITEQTLQYVQAFTGLLISRLPLGIIAVDRQGLVKTFNEVAAGMSGRRADQVINRPAATVLPPACAALLADPTGNAEIIDRELEMPDSGDREGGAAGGPAGKRTLRVSAVPVLDHQQRIIGRAAMLHDVTELKEMEKEVQRHEHLVALGKMAAGVAHEVRNPLSSIKGLATLLGDRFPAGDQEHDAARLLVNEVERLNRRISELLTYARPLPLDLRPTDLNELLRDSLKLVAADAAALQVQLDFSPAPELPLLPLDPDRITQVLLNLYLNALQAMPQGGLLRVRAAAEPGTGRVRLVVSDNGHGIAPDHLPRITDPYFTTKPDGSGLGLAMVQKIIDEHGGKLTITSREHQGTTVTITLSRGEF